MDKSQIGPLERMECPIDDVYSKVGRAEALCRCLAEIASEHYSTDVLDLYSALQGLGDILGGLHEKLDPKPFRAAVLAAAEVSHG